MNKPRFANYLYMYIDESGDLGFKTKNGELTGSQYIVFGGVICSEENAKRIVGRMRKKFKKKHRKIEIKYSELLPAYLDTAFKLINKMDYECFACHANKNKIKELAKHLEQDRRAMLLSFLIEMALLKTDFRNIKGIYIDSGLKKPQIKEQLEEQLKKIDHGLNFIKHVDSTTEAGLQIADLIVGAIHSHLKKDRENYFKEIEGKLTTQIEIQGIKWQGGKIQYKINIEEK